MLIELFNALCIKLYGRRPKREKYWQLYGQLSCPDSGFLGIFQLYDLIWCVVPSCLVALEIVTCVVSSLPRASQGIPQKWHKVKISKELWIIGNDTLHPYPRHFGFYLYYQTIIIDGTILCSQIVIWDIKCHKQCYFFHFSIQCILFYCGQLRYKSLTITASNSHLVCL